MNWFRVALFMDQSEAEQVRQLLARSGIRAELHHDPAVARLWFISDRESGFRLEVPAGDSESAARLLDSWDAETGCLHSAIRCPECGSLRIDYPQFTEKSILTNLIMGLATELRILERDFYCEACHCMWIKPSPKPPRHRLHMAPNYFLEED
jgi:hypothetical protein